jgi:hypothetical protein
MPYAQLDIHFDEHPSHADLELEHLGLMACAIAHCNRLLTDGFVSDKAVRGFGASGKGHKAAAKLVASGKWEKVDNGFVIVGYLDWNPSKAEVEERLVRKQEAGRMAGLASGRARTKNEPTGSQVVQPGPQVSGSTKTNTSPDPDPTSDPDPKEETNKHVQSVPADAGDPPSGQVVSLFKPKESRQANQAENEAITRIFNRWAEMLMANDPDATGRKLTQDRRSHIRARLRDYSEETLLLAVEGIFCSEFHVTKKFTDIASCFGNSEKVDRFLAYRSETKRLFTSGGSK